MVDSDAVRLPRVRAGGALEVVEHPGQTHSIRLIAPARLVDDMVRWLDGRGPSTATGDGV